MKSFPKLPLLEKIQSLLKRFSNDRASSSSAPAPSNSPSDKNLLLSDTLKKAIHSSTIQMRIGQLYMHYWKSDLDSSNRLDPEWLNTVVFFWRAFEPFPKKALPPIFFFREPRYFFLKKTEDLNVRSGEATPWFGMPGLGLKNVCDINGERLSIPELHARGYVDYVELVVLTEENLSVLTDREHYQFLIHSDITPYYNDNFNYQGKSISIEEAYQLGGLTLIKKVDYADRK